MCSLSVSPTLIVSLFAGFGNKRSYEISSLISVLGILVQAFSWTGSSVLRHFIQFAFAEVVLLSWTSQAVMSSIRAM